MVEALLGGEPPDGHDPASWPERTRRDERELGGVDAGELHQVVRPHSSGAPFDELSNVVVTHRDQQRGGAQLPTQEAVEVDVHAVERHAERDAEQARGEVGELAGIAREVCVQVANTVGLGS